MKKLFFITIVLFLVSGVTLQAQNKLTVTVTGIENPAGKLYIALYDNSVPFLSDKAIAGKIEKIDSSVQNIIFEGLKDGDYAITMFHDENDNGKLDLGEWGIPTEKYGFSNNVDPAELRRAPVFEECKFRISGNTTVTIQLVHTIKK